MVQCVNTNDEKWCAATSTGLKRYAGSGQRHILNHLIVNLMSPYSSLKPDTYLTPTVIKECNPTHFKCPDSERFLCLPVYLRCNKVNDCPGHEDEMECDSYECPGYYRCRNSPICVHAGHLCDSKYGQCPENDDELLCGLACPHECECLGLTFTCKQSFVVGKHAELRYLNAEKSNMTMMDLENGTMLIYVSLASCFLFNIEAPLLPNLKIIDLSDNFLTHIEPGSFNNTRILQVLVLAGNPLSILHSVSAISMCMTLRVLDLSRVHTDSINFDPLQTLVHLHTLNLSHSGVSHVHGAGFQILKSLYSLDISGCPVITFPPNMFEHLVKLRSVRASNYKMCCPAILPRGFDPHWCQAPSDAVSSCQDLMQSNLHRIMLAVLTVLALAGNLTSFLFRTAFDKRTRRFGFGVFVVHLCVSDFLMGVYLMVIGLADHVYKGIYLWNDYKWQHSAACSMAGFVSLLSSEVSAFLICIITVDRFLVLRFPFSQLHFSPKSAHICSGITWTMGVILAAMPLTDVTSHWEFYSQTGICIPLPITKTDFPGHNYSFSILICLNFVLFLFIAAGQGFIYWSVTSNTITGSGTSGKSKDQIIARRLITVAMSDFVCWFPIGVLGMLAVNDTYVPAKVNMIMAILVLPLNSALNPFLYTVNVILEHRRKENEKRLLAVLSQIQDGVQ